MVYSWLNNIQYALFPGRCVVCTEPSQRSLDLCAPCQALLLEPWTRCFHCALPCPRDTTACGHCSRRPFSFYRCEALAPYRPPIDRLISTFKYHHQLAPGKILAYLLAERLSCQYRDDRWPEKLLPVPLHWFRQWRRGYNQSHYLASELGRHLGLPVAGDLLARHRATAHQQQLNLAQRRTNLHNAFSIKGPVNLGHVALIDDVLTTGSTCDRLAELLLRNGVERVDVWCLARTPSPLG